MARLNRTGEMAGEGIRLHPTAPRTSSNTIHIPDISRELLAYLDMTFPDKLPPKDAPYEDVHKAWGKREVIEHLIQLHNQQQEENVLDVHLLKAVDASTSGSSGPATGSSTPG